MRHWFTSADAPIVTDHVKRFDALLWTVDFPRGTVASTVTADDRRGMTIEVEFLRKGDLVGLIYESEDRRAHPAHARQTSRDYSGCVLSFRWQATGMAGLDAVNGPTLTIEGKDASGAEKSWFVRLWNYAQGTSHDALVTLDFDAMVGGFELPADADPVHPQAIERMFISLVPPDYVEGSQELRSAPAQARVTISDLRCDGAGSVLKLRDAVVPEHGLRIATAYDDMYNLSPERTVEAIERLGYRKIINHYVGMSHYFALDGAGKLDPSRTFNRAALEWHRGFARAAAARGFEMIWSLSFEILDMFCPEPWKQRAFDGTAAATGYSPPSALVSPASSAAVDYLVSVAEALVEISVEAGIRPRVQVGEPWWWVTAAGGICIYDAVAKAAFGGSPVEIADVRGPLSGAQLALLEQAGALLSAATNRVAAAAKAADASTETLLLAYLPSILDPEAPELKRANMPVGWARPAFDVLQLEDYEWVTAGKQALRLAAWADADARLGYPISEQHYLSGFVPTAPERELWSEVIAAAGDARRRGVAEVFLWALPQVLRDGLTLFGEEVAVEPFEDVLFPIEIGAEASVSPAFSTNVVTSAGGHEYRNVNWQQARLSFDAGPGIRGDADLETLIAFFRARRGPAVGFRFRDSYDYSSNAMSQAPTPTDQAIGTGDGSRTQFQLCKRYGDGEVRQITRPIAGTVRVAVDGLEQVGGWSLVARGAVDFADAPAAGASVTAGFLFDVPVRFADDRLEVNRATFLAGETPSVGLIEIREG
ncbi:MAG: DUF2460 domain-containing protein [Pseudomonadota bacterium]|nr:DUF2460 domain-containing protein [Pseudomonadota bacterium]